MRADLKAISELVAPGTRVLDLGCGDGVLLRHLQDNLGVTGYGIEIEPAGVVASIGNGINVIQMNLEAGLSGFDEHSYRHFVANAASHETYRASVVRYVARGA